MHKYKTHVRYKKGVRSRRSPEEIIATLLHEVFSEHPGPICVAVGGPGGTGKSTFSRSLAQALNDAVVLRLDDYKTPRSFRQSQNVYGPHPEANKMDLVHDHLLLMKRQTSFYKPIYCSENGQASSTEEFTPRRFNILDGEIATYRQFRDMVDFSIFIDSDWKTQLRTRISRDIESRGYSREKAIATFLQSNLREFTRYGAESKCWADIHLYCHEDYRFTIESVAEELYQRFEGQLAMEYAPVNFSGLVVPVTVPFSEDDRIDKEMFIQHLEFLAEKQVRKILINGTMGEFFSLTLEERRQLLSLGRSYFPGVIFYQAGCGGLTQTIEEARRGEDYGADAILALTPYFLSNLTTDGLVKYFDELSNKIDTPLILYNFPQHTQNNITKEVLSQVKHYGLKDSSASLKLIGKTPRYYLGGDPFIMKSHKMGGFGFISGSANHAPDVYVGMERALIEKDYEAAAKFQEQINRISRIHSGPREIQNIKQALSKVIVGYPTRVRLPLT